ncbi:hypothetical protein B0H12DRAFT_1300240 [Mycena haematopus]|nr:hypothetical protein B0H12DRAFT_1300240 [Mycena haematopus]
MDHWMCDYLNDEDWAQPTQNQSRTGGWGHTRHENDWGGAPETAWYPARQTAQMAPSLAEEQAQYRTAPYPSQSQYQPQSEPLFVAVNPFEARRWRRPACPGQPHPTEGTPNARPSVPSSQPAYSNSWGDIHNTRISVSAFPPGFYVPPLVELAHPTQPYPTERTPNARPPVPPNPTREYGRSAARSPDMVFGRSAARPPEVVGRSGARSPNMLFERWPHVTESGPYGFAPRSRSHSPPSRPRHPSRSRNRSPRPTHPMHPESLRSQGLSRSPAPSPRSAHRRTPSSRRDLSPSLASRMTFLSSPQMHILDSPLTDSVTVDGDQIPTPPRGFDVGHHYNTQWTLLHSRVHNVEHTHSWRLNCHRRDAIEQHSSNFSALVRMLFLFLIRLIFCTTIFTVTVTIPASVFELTAFVNTDVTAGIIFILGVPCIRLYTNTSSQPSPPPEAESSNFNPSAAHSSKKKFVPPKHVEPEVHNIGTVASGIIHGNPLAACAIASRTFKDELDKEITKWHTNCEVDRNIGNDCKLVLQAEGEQPSRTMSVASGSG